MTKFMLIILSFGLYSPFLWAQAEAGDAQPSFLVQSVPFLGMFFVFYFLIMRPQIKKTKTHQEFLQSIKKGDRVLTSSGIFGTIEGLNDKYVTLAIADDVNIRVLKTHVSHPIKEGKDV